MFLKNQIEKLGEQIVFSGLDMSDEFTETKHKILQTRLALSLAGYLVCCRDSILSEYYQLLKARGKHHLTAVGAVIRKLCNIIFTILGENSPYEQTPPKKGNKNI